MRKIKKYNLEFKKTFPYFIDHIECGKTLSKKVIERIDFHQGMFFTLLPSHAKLDKLYEFSYGGIIPPIPYGDQTYCIEEYSMSFHPQQVITMDHDFSKFIAAYIKINPRNHRAILENYMSEPDSLHTNIENVKTAFYDREVYYLLDKENSVGQICKAIRKAGQVWHFLAVLTAIENIMSTSLKNEDLNQICDNSKFIIAGAYDGEGYIFWEKSSSA